MFSMEAFFFFLEQWQKVQKCEILTRVITELLKFYWNYIYWSSKSLRHGVKVFLSHKNKQTKTTKQPKTEQMR